MRFSNEFSTIFLFPFYVMFFFQERQRFHAISVVANFFAY